MRSRQDGRINRTVSLLAVVLLIAIEGIATAAAPPAPAAVGASTGNGGGARHGR